MKNDSKKCWLVYLVGSCEMGSEGWSDILFPCVCYGDTDEEILEDYLTNIEKLYEDDFMRKNLEYYEDGSVCSYYPIHKVKIPRPVYGHVKDYSMILTYREHKLNSENEPIMSSITYEGEPLCIKKENDK